MENRTVTLKTPIKRGENEIKEVQLREPRSGELRGLDNFSVLRMDVNAHRTLVPRISNLTANEFDALPPKDLLAVQQEVVAFFTE
ncbi:phage tail assembly protein [Halomonas sp. OfavH-34-E]|uniref:phage tail assembly protein n=1 Tax=Halomonas sp. OfavH-34-E TaxID=2954491 RepID=UPI002097CE51|nr:phage tail assembly protein [Halomonas sp. OfavH-34-E]MCO7217122.1 phage tail assembly protein [Halomonas sp. OfavH-34-E]